MPCGSGWFSPMCGYNVTPFNVLFFMIAWILLVTILILYLWGVQEIEENARKEAEEKAKQEAIIVDRNKHNK
jgi:CHASE3 domain sensor protein